MIDLKTIDFKQSNIHVTIFNKETNKAMVSGKLSACKNLPELMISFDAKYFFVVRDNPLYRVELTDNEDKLMFNFIEYKDYIFPYKGVDSRDTSNEFIFREFSIDELDPEIAPLVYALNDAGYETTGSCCGHGRNIAWIHVIFRDFVLLRQFIRILERDEFKFEFQLTTSPDIIDIHPRTLKLSLQTYKMGEDAYRAIDMLTDYINKELKSMQRLDSLRA